MDGKLGAGNLRYAVGRLVRFGVPGEAEHRENRCIMYAVTLGIPSSPCHTQVIHPSTSL